MYMYLKLALLTIPTGNTIAAKKKSLNFCRDDNLVSFSVGLTFDPHKSLITHRPKYAVCMHYKEETDT